jgi:flagellar biosynthesis protein FliQ
MEPGTLDMQVLDLAREMIGLALLIAGPLLLVGLVVGVIVSVFQALTSVQEQTLSVVPKMFAVILAGLLLLAPALGLLRDFCMRVISQLNTFGLS